MVPARPRRGRPADVGFRLVLVSNQARRRRRETVSLDTLCRALHDRVVELAARGTGFEHRRLLLLCHHHHRDTGVVAELSRAMRVMPLCATPVLLRDAAAELGPRSWRAPAGCSGDADTGTWRQRNAAGAACALIEHPAGRYIGEPAAMVPELARAEPRVRSNRGQAAERCRRWKRRDPEARFWEAADGEPRHHDRPDQVGGGQP
jgi:hypothetical protein